MLDTRTDFARLEAHGVSRISNEAAALHFRWGETCYRIDEADESLRTQVARALAASGRRQVAELYVVAQGGQITLRGSLPSYYMLQLAQHAAMEVDGVESVESQISIIRPREQFLQ